MLSVDGAVVVAITNPPQCGVSLLVVGLTLDAISYCWGLESTLIGSG